MFTILSDWWYNRNKEYYEIPRGKDISEPIITIVNDVINNRHNYRILLQDGYKVQVYSRKLGMLYEIGRECAIYSDVDIHNKVGEGTLWDITFTSDELDFLTEIRNNLRAELKERRDFTTALRARAKREQLQELISSFNKED